METLALCQAARSAEPLDQIRDERTQVLAHLAFTRYSLHKKSLNPENLSAIRMAGDSNEPVLGDCRFDGSVLIISEDKACPAMAFPRERLDSLQIIGRAVWAGGWLF